MRTTIYCFTGTGNSLKVAKDIAKHLPNTEIIRIHKGNAGTITEAAEGKVGFIFPVYYYGIPRLMKKFIKRLCIRENVYIFAVLTCGGSVGPTMNSLKKLLTKKKLELAAGYGVIMPDNYIIFYDPPSQEQTLKMLREQERISRKIALAVLSDERHTFSEKKQIIAMLFGPIAAAIFPQKRCDRHFWLEDTCSGCGTCARLCPADDIVMKDGKPEWRHQCEQCFACIHTCPQKAIQYKKGTASKGRYRNPGIKLGELLIKKD